MAGGEGAKERRKLMRQQKEKELVKKPAGKGVKPAKGINTSHKGGKPFKKMATTPKKSPAKKFKKPKHLKRKLEQISTEDNEEAKQEVLQQMEDWDRQKSDFVTKVSKKRRRSKAPEEQPKETPETPDAMEDVEDTVEESEPEPEKEPELLAETSPETKTSKAPTNDNDSSDEEDDEDDVEEQQRQRGRRRRGRKDTSKKIQEEEKEAPPKKTPQKEKTKKTEETPSNRSSEEADGSKRYCIGRKPVTDFAIGQKCEGRVVYVKPFGVFLDIGCHSDAFCHVSRLSDGYVEDPTANFKEGDVVSARVVEIDRPKKRITVSLQSEDRLEDEKASILARKQRKDARKTKSTTTASSSSSTPKSSTKKAPTDDKKDSTPVAKTPEVKKIPTPVKQQPMTQPPVVRASAPPAQPDPENMTPAELKRARKLARRAARREEAAENEN